MPLELGHAVPTADVVGRFLVAKRAAKASQGFRLHILTQKEMKRRASKMNDAADVERQRLAVLRLELAWRARKARIARLQRESAVALQSRYRGWSTRRQLCKQLAARTIQYYARRRLALQVGRQLESLKEALLVLQRAFLARQSRRAKVRACLASAASFERWRRLCLAERLKEARRLGNIAAQRRAAEKAHAEAERREAIEKKAAAERAELAAFQDARIYQQRIEAALVVISKHTARWVMRKRIQKNAVERRCKRVASELTKVQGLLTHEIHDAEHRCRIQRPGHGQKRSGRTHLARHSHALLQTPDLSARLARRADARRHNFRATRRAQQRVSASERDGLTSKFVVPVILKPLTAADFEESAIGANKVPGFDDPFMSLSSPASFNSSPHDGLSRRSRSINASHGGPGAGGYCIRRDHVLAPL